MNRTKAFVSWGQRTVLVPGLHNGAYLISKSYVAGLKEGGAYFKERIFV